MSIPSEHEIESEVKLEACGQSPRPREIVIERQRIEPIVAIREVEQPQARFGPPLKEAVADEQIELPKIRAGLRRGVARIGLRGPDAVELAEKAERVIVVRVEIQLVQRGLDVRIQLIEPGGASRNIYEGTVQMRIGQFIAAA